jgi:hypothetical protein
VQVEFTWLISPSSGTGVQGHIWVHIALSSVNFNGIGERAVPAAPPIRNDKKLLRSIFIDSVLKLKTFEKPFETFY